MVAQWSVNVIISKSGKHFEKTQLYSALLSIGQIHLRVTDEPRAMVGGDDGGVAALLAVRGEQISDR
jgi:hypothetical protein